MDLDWLTLPIGIDADRWASRAGRRQVLVIAHTIVSSQRLLDISDLVESDHRIQVVFTAAPDVFNPGVEEYLRELGAFGTALGQAVRERFDLAVAASHGGLSKIHAPLVVMAHGACHGKHKGGAVYGLDAERLMRSGRMLPVGLRSDHGPVDLAPRGRRREACAACSTGCSGCRSPEGTG